MEKIFVMFLMLNHEVFSYHNQYVDEYNLHHIEYLMTNKFHHEEHDVHTNNKLNHENKKKHRNTSTRKLSFITISTRN